MTKANNPNASFILGLQLLARRRRRHLLFVIVSCGLSCFCYCLVPIFATPSTVALRNQLPVAVQGHREADNVDLSNRESLRYVTLCSTLPLWTARRTGNHLFMLSAAVYLAERTGRRFTMPKSGWPLDDVFSLESVERYDNLVGYKRPCRELWPRSSYFFHGDFRFDTEAGFSELRRASSPTLALCGLYQTFRYAEAVNSKLRRLLRFKPEVLRLSDKFIDNSRPREWSVDSYVRVGVHIRRGDFLNPSWVKFGMTVVDSRYVNSALDYFTSRHRRVQFLVASDDMTWTKSVFRRKYFGGSNSSDEFATPIRLPSEKTSADERWASVAFSEGNSAGVDLAVLSSCEAVIMSTGSFGWWAAWLANKTTVYYSDWPQLGSSMSASFNKSVYFPPNWIPLR